MRPPAKMVSISYAVRLRVESFARALGASSYGDPMNLSGWCAIASYYLLRQLRSRGYQNAKFCANEDHCWLEWNGCLIDLTASQFGVGRRVYITYQPREFHWEAHRGDRAVGYVTTDWYECDHRWKVALGSLRNAKAVVLDAFMG
jgi:hypothetical protein